MRYVLCAILTTAVLRLMATATDGSLTQAQLDSIEGMFNLNEVVVTGTRTPKTLKDTPIQTRLISSDELRQTDATNIQDLLQQTMPGIEFSYAMNQQTNMNLAGFSGQGVLILLDGERLAGETMENTDYDRLDLNGVSHVEIVRGAASALYGSNAAGGVINIVTKEPDRLFTANINARVADHNERRIGGNVSLSHHRVSNVLDVAYKTIDTYTVCLDTRDMCDFRNVYGYHSYNFRDRIVYTPFDGLKLTARAGYFFKERLYNPDTPDRYRDFSAGLRALWEIDSNNTLDVTYAFDQYDKSDLIRDFGLDIRDYSNVQNSVRMLYTSRLRNSDILTCGGDLMRDYLDTYQFEAGMIHHQYTADIFGQYDWNIDSRWELVGALRWDYFSDNGDNRVTGKLNSRYRHDRLTLRGGYSGGFRAPTLKEMYMNYNMADIFDIHGNPKLKPETSHNLNLSAEYVWKNYYLVLGGTYNMVHNRITTSGIRYDITNAPYIDYINVHDLRVFGLDATIRAQWRNGMSASLSYNYTHEGTSGVGISQYCPARPHSLNIRINWNHVWSQTYSTDLTLTGHALSSVSYQSMYMYQPFETRTITNPAYTLWRVQLSQHLWDKATVTVAVDNIFNYAPAVYTFNAPVTLGANLQVGLSVNI